MENTATSSTQIWFEMSHGAGVKMYTLWRCVTAGEVHNRVYIKNLGTDHAASLAAAREYCGLYELIDDSADTLRAILKGDDVVRFGKYNETRVGALPDGYLMFICGGAEVNGVYYAESKLAEAAKLEAVKRGLYDWYNGEMLPVKLIAYLKRMDAGWGHYHAEKSRVTLELEVLKETSYEGTYGRTYIYIFEDVATGNKYEYKGSKSLSRSIEDESCDEVYECLEKGMTVQITGAIKHGEYRGKLVTYLQRLKITPRK